MNGQRNCRPSKNCERCERVCQFLHDCLPNSARALSMRNNNSLRPQDKHNPSLAWDSTESERGSVIRPLARAASGTSLRKLACRNRLALGSED